MSDADDDMGERRLFRNRVASLYNLDKHVVDVELRKGGVGPLTDEEWARFRYDPPRFFINTDTPTSEAIWRCVEARQRKEDRGWTGQACGYRGEKDGRPFCFAAGCAPKELADRATGAGAPDA